MRSNALAVMLAICIVASSVMLPMAAAEPDQSLVSIVAPLANDITGRNVTAEWETDPSVVSCRAWLDGTELSDIGPNGSIELSYLTEGQHLLVVRAYNVTSSGVASVAFFVDTVGPELLILSPAYGDELNTSSVTLRWRSDDASSVARYEIHVENSQGFELDMALNHTSSEYILESLADESYTATIKAFDGAGRSTERMVRFSVDTTVPVLEIISPQDGSGFTGKVVVTWTSSDAGGNLLGFNVFLNGDLQTTVASMVGTYNFGSLKDGEYEVVVRAVDRANNTAQDRVSFIIDSVPLAIVDTSPGSAATIGADVRVTFSKVVDKQASIITVEGVNGTISWDGHTMIFTPQHHLAIGTTYMVSVAARDDIGRWANTTWSFTTTAGAIVTGIVHDPSGAPLVNAKVSVPGGPSTVTDENGAFRLEIPSGNQTLTISLAGYVTQTMPVNIAPGAERFIGAVQMTSADLITMVGWIVAIAAIAIVALIYYLKKQGPQKKRRRPPAPRGRGKAASRSWKGLEELEKRSRREHRVADDQYDDQYDDERL